MPRSGLVHWVSWTLAVACMLVTTVGYLALPAAQGPDGLVTVHQVFVDGDSGAHAFDLDGLSQVAQAYLLIASACVVAFLWLVAGVAGQRSWSRFVAVLPAGLGLLVLAGLGIFFLTFTQSYDGPETIALRRQAGVELAVLAGLVLVAIAFMLARRRRVYDILVVAVMVVLAIWHTVTILLLQAFDAVELRFTVLAFLPTPGYLVAAALTAAASFGRRTPSPSRAAAAAGRVDHPWVLGSAAS